MRAGRCASCGKRGHDAAPGGARCARSHQAVLAIAERGLAIAERGLSMREAARLFGVTVSSVHEELRRNPAAWRRALDTGAEIRAAEAARKPPRGPRRDRPGRPPSVLVDLAVDAVANDRLSLRDASWLYGVSKQAIYQRMRRVSRR